MKIVTSRSRPARRLARAASLCLLALTAALLNSREARAQWSAPDAGGNINSTNTGNVGIGTPAPQFSLDVTGNDGTPFRIRDKTGREYFSTGVRTGPYPTWTTPVVSLSGGRLVVENSGPDGNNDTILRHIVNNLYFYPSDHPDLPGAFVVRQKGGNNVLVIDQNTNGNVSINGNVGIGTGTPQFLLDVMGSAGKPFRVRDANGLEYFATGTRTGPWGTTPVTSLSGGRLMVENNGPDGGNETIIRHVVNGIHFYPSEHPDLPGAFAVWQKGGTVGLVVGQNANGNVGIGTSNPASKLHVAGNITVDGNINAKYQDVAEWVPTTQKLQPGTVVVLDTERANHVSASTSAYDTRVAGVVSAQPGIALGEAGEGKALVATTGRVKVKVDATRAAIKIGDLIVTSDAEGVGMKSEPIAIGGRQIHAPGTIIGKALEPLDKGTGEILVLLSLQ
jgi:hypothetical protein